MLKAETDPTDMLGRGDREAWKSFLLTPRPMASRPASSCLVAALLCAKATVGEDGATRRQKEWLLLGKEEG